MTKSAVIGIRVDPKVKRAAKNAALDDYRSIASLLEMLLVKHLTECGYLNGRTSVGMTDDPNASELVTNYFRGSSAVAGRPNDR